MKQITHIILYTCLMALFFSCSDDSQNDADPIIGSWEGEVVQPGFGTSSLTLTMSELIIDGTSGQLSSEVTDLSECDNEIYYCEFSSCSVTWIYKGRKGDEYLFFEDAPASSDCVDGNVTVRFNNNDEITFSFIGIGQTEVSSFGTLKRI